jgi:hypothetical protein
MALVLKTDREADVLVRFLHGLVNLHLAPPVARPERHSPALSPQPSALGVLAADPGDVVGHVAHPVGLRVYPLWAQSTRTPTMQVSSSVSDLL